MSRNYFSSPEVAKFLNIHTKQEFFNKVYKKSLKNTNPEASLYLFADETKVLRDLKLYEQFHKKVEEKKCESDQIYINASLGRGANGFVNKICIGKEHCPEDEQYAFKTIKIKDAEDLNMFWNEVLIQKTLSEEGIAPKILAAWTCCCFNFDPDPDDDDDSYGYVDNYIKGYILMTIAKKKRENYEITLKELNKIQEILNKLHIIHGDLKADNFILGKKKATLIDFGLSLQFKKNGELYERFNLFPYKVFLESKVRTFQENWDKNFLIYMSGGKKTFLYKSESSEQERKEYDTWKTNKKDYLEQWVSISPS